MLVQKGSAAPQTPVAAGKGAGRHQTNYIASIAQTLEKINPQKRNCIVKVCDSA